MSTKEATLENGKKSEKIGIFSTTMIGVAFAISLNLFSAGAAPDLSFKNTIIVVLCTWIMLAGVWTLSGLMGQISGRGAADIFRFSFGNVGARIPSILIVIVNGGNALFDYWYVGSVMRNMMPERPHLGFAIGMAIITIAVILGIIKEITSLKWLTTLTVPFAAVMFVIIAATTISKSGGMDVILSYEPPIPTPVFLAINTMFGCFCSISAAFSDISKDCTSKKAVIIAMPVSMLVVVLQCGLAQMGKIGLAAVDISSLALALGGAVFYITNVFVMFGQVNTCPTSSYMIMNQAYASMRIPKKVMTFVQPLIACGLAFALEYGADLSLFTPWLNLASAIFGPMIGVLFAEFYVVQRRKLSDDEKLPRFALAGCTSLLVSFLVCVYLTYFVDFSAPVAIIGIALSFVVQIILRKYTKLR